MKPRILPIARLSFSLAAALAALLAAPSAHATLLYWDTNGTTANSGAATGTWGTDVFWNTDSNGGAGTFSTTTSNADDLFFAAGTGGTAGTVTVSGTRAAHSITFEEGSITLTGGTIDLGSATAGSGISFANVAGYNVNSAIVLNSAATAIAFTNKGNQGVTFGTTGTITGSATTGTQTITIGGAGVGGGSLTFSGIISDGGGGGKVGVTVNGSAGVFGSANLYTLGAANTYTGATSIIYGGLSINNASTFANTSAINLSSYSRLIVNAANASLAKLATGSGVVAGSYLRYSTAQTTAGAGNGPGTIFGTVELNLTNVNPNYTLDFGAGGALTNLVTSTYISALTLSGTASIDSSTAVATYTTGGITASTAGAKTLNLTGSNTGANTISSAIGDGSGSIAVIKGGGGAWVLSGTNTYTGNTLVSGGILQFTNQVSLYNNGAAAAWTKTNVNVGSGATLAFNVGGSGQFTKGNIITLLGLADATTNGFNSGSTLGLDTTGGSLLYDSVIADTNSGTNVLGLTKLGTNTLTLDQSNTYTGRTVISAGTLQLGNGSTTGKLSTSSTILNNGTLTINRGDTVAQGTDFSATPINGTGAFIQAGAGTTTLSAANTFSGTTTVSAGTLTLTNALALQNSALVTTGAGTLTLSGPTTLTLGGLSGASGNLATIITSGYTGTVTALTLNPLSGSVTYGGVIANGAMSLTKNGAGTQILSGANTYTGSTIVNGGTLTVGSGATGSLSSSSTLQMGGGIFNYSRTGAGQTVNGLTVNAGNSTVNNTSSGQTLTLGGITRTASIYGTVNFATLTGPISTTTGNTNSILGPWATTGSTTTLKYAVGSADGSTATNISSLTGTTATAGTLANLTDATGNFEYAAAATTSANLTANTLRYSGVATATAIGATNTLTLNGLMNAGTGALTVSGGPSTGGILIGSTNELVVAANAQNTTISSVIKDGASAGRLVYGGAGSTLTLSGLNTYSGGLVINSGIVATGAAASVSSGGTGTGPITVNGAGRLTLNSGVGTLNRAFTLNGGALYFNGSGNDTTVAGTIVFGANSTIDATNTNSGFPIITADTSGTGGFTKTNSGGLRLNGSNTYSGPTVVSAGGLTVKSSLYGNVTSNWTPANITVASSATLVLNVQGAGEFTIAQAATMFSQLSSNVNNNGLLAGSIIGVDTRNASAGTYTYSANITDSTGAGGGSVSFKHTGTANTILELTGTNTYTGMSIVDNGSFLKVSSLNSVFTNAALGTVHSASSSLGAPTTVANGTIHLGTGGSTAISGIGNTFMAGGLIYTGTGETTDRVISLNDGGLNQTSTLDQSGTGNLKFISPFATQDNRGIKIFQLQGSTTGTGEIAGSIGDLGNNLKLTKSGTGTWTLSAANYHLGVTTVNGGALVLANANALNGGIGTTGGLGALTFSGGVIGLGAGDFSRPLAAANTVGAVNFTGAGGWAAYGADRVVNLGGASATVTWATANTGLNGQTLILGNTTATHTVDFQNPLDMGTAARTVQMDNGAAAIDGKLSGIISGGSGGNLTKTGLGTLALTGANTYTGTTTVSAGTLSISSVDVVANANPLGKSSVAAANLLLGNGTTLQYTGAAASTDRSFTINGSSAGHSATLDASGSGAVNFTSTSTPAYGTNNQTRTLNLTGTNAGANTLAANIADNGSGAVSLTKSGAGTWVLSGTNTRTGTTGITGGMLVFAKQQALYNSTQASWTPTQITVASGAVLALGVGDSASGYFDSAAVDTFRDGSHMGLSTTTTGFQSGALLGFDTSNATAGSFSYNSIIGNFGSSATNGVAKLGGGTLVLGGANTYSGETTIQAGSLVAGTDSLASTNGAFGNASSAIVLGNGSTAATNAPAILINGAYTVGRAITVGSLTNTAAYNATIGGSNASGTATYTGNITLNTTAANYTASLQAATGGTVEFMTGTWNTGNKAIAIGSASNTGTVKLSNNITTSGGITVNYGTLALNSTLTGGLAVNSGAILAPGGAGATATATVAGATATTFNDGSIFSWDISSTGTSFDKLVSASGLTDGGPAGGAVLRIVAADDTFADTFWSSNKTWTDIFTTNGTTAIADWANIFTSVTVVNSSFNSITPVGGSFSAVGSTLTWTAVPEPTSALAGLLLGSGLLRRRRK